MKQFIVLWLAGFLVTAAGAKQSVPQTAPLTKEQQDRLKERDQFEKDVTKLRAEGKLTEAIAAAEHVLAIQREVYGDLHAEVADSLQYLAGMHELREDFPASRKARQEILRIKT